MISDELRVTLADPAISLRAFAHVVDQETGQDIPYDPEHLTESMQSTIISYVSDPPRDEDGYTRWLTVLKGRQGGASTTAALAFYPKVAYGDGVKSIIIADKKDRADDLFDRVMYNHAHWDASVRVEQQSANEVRQFTTVHNSSIKVLSGEGRAVGIGKSVDYFLGSELPYWGDAGGQFSLILPSMRNRKNALMILESTPAPLDEPSTGWWMDHCTDAAKGLGRDLYAFFPFWDTKLNRRRWPKSRALENDEIRLMDRYGPKGMTLENLAFRRFTMEDDKKIRKNPDLFGVYYPFDDVTCWINSGIGVIPRRLIEKHTANVFNENEGYTEFRPPEEDAIYCIGVDPAGYGARDHASFQVLELWDDAWIQVASYGAVTDPEDFVDLLIRTGERYNNAKLFVERNGVGAATLALLKSKKYRNLFYDSAFKPGMHKSNESEWLSILTDALMDKLKLFGKDTVKQLISYRSDRLTERTLKSELLSDGAGPGAGRRGRHHWDKVSALMVACVGARTMPTRIRHKELPDNVIMYKDMTWDQIMAYEARCEAMREARIRGTRTRYTRIRHRGR